MMAIVGFFSFIGALLYCVFTVTWLDSIDKTAPRITFDAFKKLYVIAPAKWDLGCDDVYYRGDDRQIIEFKHYIDVIRYNLFKDKVERDKEYLARIQNEKEFLASVQKDIESYRRENFAELERIINNTQSNAENLLQKAEVNSGGDDY